MRPKINKKKLKKGTWFDSRTRRFHVVSPMCAIKYITEISLNVTKSPDLYTLVNCFTFLVYIVN